MDIYEILSTEHRRFENLIDQIIESSEKDNDEWKALVEELKKDVVAHSRAEEAVFYNTLRNLDQAKLITKSYGEHAMAENELRTLSLAQKANANMTSLMKRLSKDLKDHIDREESEVFSAARKVLSDDEAVKLGEAFLKLRPEVEKDADSLTSNAIDLVSNILPDRIADTFKRNLDKKEGPGEGPVRP